MTRSSSIAEENGSLMPETPQDDDNEQEYTSLKRSLSRITNYQRADRHEHPAMPAPSKPVRNSTDLHINIPQLPMAADIALAALQYLPTPLIVLTSLKTILLANEAMGRLLGLELAGEEIRALSANTNTVTERLKGKTLSQIGVDIIQDGIPVWVSWEKFLDNLSNGLEDGEIEREQSSLPDIQSGETTPVATLSGNGRGGHLATEPDCPPKRNKTVVHDTVVDVVVSSQHDSISGSGVYHRHHKPRSPTYQTPAKMIISIWQIEEERFFSLSFTNTSSVLQKSHSKSHVVSRPPMPTSNSHLKSSLARSSTPTSSRSSSAHSSVLTSPVESNINGALFPPHGAPSQCLQPGAFTEYQKVTRMKDAMLSAMEIPVLAMWKDESVVFPNPAARRMLAVVADPTTEDSYDFISRFKAHAPDFGRELRQDEFPMASLCRNQKGFSSWKIGMIEPRSGERRNYDVSGKPVFDEKTGDFFAGLIAFKDVTEYTEKLASQSEENEQQFQLMCDSMPQMLWTTRPDGYHDYFSKRWFEYTKLSPQQCFGLGWKLPFHPDDVAESVKRWQHCLATGDEYLTEYRCRRHDGEWRWMLGRALPLHDSRTGKILKWFGSCTDIQEVRSPRKSGDVTGEVYLVHDLRSIGSLSLLLLQMISVWLTFDRLLMRGRQLAR
jgi:PAS domain S-box-containing protein